MRLKGPSGRWWKPRGIIHLLGPGRAEVIEAMVMEHLGPVLRSWLDEHLPGIVERIVEREVRDLIQHAGGTKT